MLHLLNDISIAETVYVTSDMIGGRKADLYFSLGTNSIAFCLSLSNLLSKVFPDKQESLSFRLNLELSSDPSSFSIFYPISWFDSLPSTGLTLEGNERYIEPSLSIYDLGLEKRSISSSATSVIFLPKMNLRSAGLEAELPVSPTQPASLVFDRSESPRSS